MVSGFEVEEGVLQNQAIEDAAVVGVLSVFGEEDIYLFVTVKPETTISQEEIKLHCRKVMAKFMVPKYITILMKCHGRQPASLKKVD